MFKIIGMVWSFLWEVIVGEVTVTQAVQKSKMKVFVVILFMLSLVINVFAIRKIVAISKYSLELREKVQVIQATCAGVSTEQYSGMIDELETLKKDYARVANLASTCEANPHSGRIHTLRSLTVPKPVSPSEKTEPAEKVNPVENGARISETQKRKERVARPSTKESVPDKSDVREFQEFFTDLDSKDKSKQ